jgi:hypothetical protein
MKKIIFLLLISFVTLQGCVNILEEENPPIATADYLSTPTGFNDAVTGAYSYLRSYYAHGEDGLSLAVFGTDEYTEGSDGGRKYFNQYSTQLNSAASPIENAWTWFYKGINCANAAIDRASEVESGLSQEIYTSRLAEAHFLRAHYYFLLVQFFGEVTIEEHETTELTTEAHRASIDKIYDLIVADLDFAVANLPESQTDYGRATKWAALHMVAKVHLTRATMDNTITAADEYQLSLDAAEAIIESETFSLQDDFASVFEQGSAEMSDEVVWSVQYSDDLLTGGSNTAHLYFLMTYDVLPGMTRSLEYGRPFKRFKPTTYGLNVFDRSIDSRYDKSFVTVYYCNNPGNVTINGRTTYMELGDTAIWLPGVELDPAVIASKDYTVLTPSMYTTKLYPSLTKYMDATRLSFNDANGSRDFLLCRYAETYLIAAEAELGLGHNANAATWVNFVRRRAAQPGMEAEMEVSADDITMDFILDERTRELIGETHRWFDLVRTHKLVERVKLYNPQGAGNVKDFHALRPIPQSQIDRVINSDGTVYGQNTGY